MKGDEYDALNLMPWHESARKRKRNEEKRLRKERRK